MFGSLNFRKRGRRVSPLQPRRAPTAAAAEAVKAKHDSFRDREEDQWDLNKRYSDLANPTLNPDGSTIVLPNYNERTGEITEGAPRAMNAQLREQMLARAAQARRKAAGHAASAAGIRKSMKWGEFAPAQQPAPAPAQTAQPAATQPAQPTAATPATPQAAAPAKPTRKYSAKEIMDWAKANGKDPADALKRARTNGLL